MISALTSKAEEVALLKAEELVKEASPDCDKEMILDDVSRETEKVSQESIKEFFENLNK